MTKFVLVLFCALTCHAGLFSGTVPVNDLISVSEQSSTAWTDLGTEKYTGSADTVGLWMSVGINNSSSFRVRILGRHTTGGSNFVIPSKVASSANFTTSPSYYQIDYPDQKIFLSWDLDKLVNYIIFQTSVGTAGTSTARIYEAKIGVK